MFRFSAFAALVLAPLLAAQSNVDSNDAKTFEYNVQVQNDLADKWASINSNINTNLENLNSEATYEGLLNFTAAAASPLVQVLHVLN